MSTTDRFNALSAAYHEWLIGNVSTVEFAGVASRYIAEIEFERDDEKHEAEQAGSSK